MKPDPDLERLVDGALAKLREKMLQDLQDSGATHGTLDQIEDAVARLGDEFRRAFQEQLVETRLHAPRENQIDCACGGRARFHVIRTRRLLTRHGELVLARPYYYCHACRCGFAPLDAALGLSAASTTAALQGWMADLAARLPFQEATGILARLTGVWVSPALLERTAVALGHALRAEQHAEAAHHQAGRPPAAARKPKRLYISIDGLFVPLRDPWKWDGSLGGLSCRFGECKTAVVYEAHATDGGDQGVARASYIASLEEVKAFTPLVSTLAHRWGHHYARELVVLADGAPWIWNLAATQFPTALQILDFFHVSEYLYRVAHAFFGEGSQEAKEWVRECQGELKRNGWARVMKRLHGLEGGSKEQEKVRATAIGYFTENRERMRYGTYLSKGYQIGSGVMEASCKHVVGQRLDQAGMHWSEAAAEAIVALRAALLSTRPPDLRPYCHRSGTPLPHS